MTWLPKRTRSAPPPAPSTPPTDDPPLSPFLQSIADSLPEKAFFRRDEVATFLNVSKRTVETWVSEGRLQEVQYFDTTIYRIPRQEILKNIHLARSPQPKNCASPRKTPKNT